MVRWLPSPYANDCLKNVVLNSVLYFVLVMTRNIRTVCKPGHDQFCSLVPVIWSYLVAKSIDCKSMINVIEHFLNMFFLIMSQ